MKRRFNVRLPHRGRDGNRGPTLFALALHVVALIVIGRTISVPVLDFLQRSGERPVEERITYVQPEPQVVPPVIAPVEPPPATVTEVPPPTVVRPAAPPLPTMPTLGDTGAGRRPPAGQTPPTTGRQAFGSGVQGLSTGRVDPRLVTPPPMPPGPVRNQASTAQQSVDSWVAAYWDSVAKVQANLGRRPGDWTAERDGMKFGMDQQYIYFGKFKLPTVLLALLPINAQANPGTVERNRALESMRYEINFHAQRAHNEADFRKAVDALRARRERERQAQKQNTPPPGGTSNVPPNDRR